MMKVNLAKCADDQIRVELEFGEETRVLFLFPNDAMYLASAILDQVQNPDSPDETLLEININPAWLERNE